MVRSRSLGLDTDALDARLVWGDIGKVDPVMSCGD